jgi:hypothetical protein
MLGGHKQVVLLTFGPIENLVRWKPDRRMLAPMVGPRLVPQQCQAPIWKNQSFDRDAI